MLSGKVVEWNDAKGYGFISAMNGELKVFFHISDINNKHYRPKVNDKVSFVPEKDQRGRNNAKQINVLGVSSGSCSTDVFAIVFFIVASVAVLLFSAEKLIIAVYAMMSLITYWVFKKDKQAAQKEQFRVAESTLLMLSFFGGWPGALHAQNHLRHKSQKQPFKAMLWMAILANMMAFYWLLTPKGKAFISNLTVLIQ